MKRRTASRNTPDGASDGGRPSTIFARGIRGGWGSLFGVLLATFSLSAAAPAAPKPLDLRFKDTRYLTRTLDDLPGKRAAVLVFLSPSCPLATRYLPTLTALEKTYRDKGVSFLGVHVGGESIKDIAAFGVAHELAFPQVRDEGQAVVKALGITRTPEVVVIDADKKVRYQGRIDDRHTIGGSRDKATRDDLREAIDAVLSKKDVAVATTVVAGCPITPLEVAEDKREVTYTEHVEPILRKNCVECHRANTAAPFALTSYADASKRAAAIAETVADGRMPPWYGVHKPGAIVNERSLSDKERATVAAWVRGGRKRGPDRDAAEIKPAGGWRIGTPDRILRGPETEIPPDGIVEYKYVVPAGVFLHDTWITGAEIVPDNPRVLHHCNMAYVSVGEKWSMNNFITGYVPGGEAMTLEPGVGYKIAAGSVLILQAHFVTTGKKERCRISVGLKYASGKIDKHLRFSYLVDHRFAIPPGDPAHRVAASRTLPCDAVGVAMFSHMHVRGRDMTFLAHRPGEKAETLLTVPNYNFDWQQAYRWKPGAMRFPKGTRLEAVAHYDNSAFNPFNPDPKATVRNGQQTHDEMMNGFVFWLDADEKLGIEVDGKTGRAVRAK